MKTHMVNRCISATTEAALRTENEALRRELLRQWWENHFEHCGRDWPHDSGVLCRFPLPKLIGRDEALRLLDDLA